MYRFRACSLTGHGATWMVASAPCLTSDACAASQPAGGSSGQRLLLLGPEAQPSSPAAPAADPGQPQAVRGELPLPGPPVQAPSASPVSEALAALRARLQAQAGSLGCWLPPVPADAAAGPKLKPAQADEAMRPGAPAPQAVSSGSLGSQAPSPAFALRPAAQPSMPESHPPRAAQRPAFASAAERVSRALAQSAASPAAGSTPAPFSRSSTSESSIRR